MSNPEVVPDSQPSPVSPAELDSALALAHRITGNIELAIFGKRDVIELVLIGMFSDGHVLLEDVPGVGKTILARALARSVRAEFKRIQFTPDLLPADVTGANTYDQKENRFTFRPGPIFANILLADEINRTSPRTQSALLEAMEERQVTVDGVTYPVPRPFFVIATQNPVEQQGTYDLPEAQLDRFILRVKIGYPSVEHEADILEAQRRSHPIEELEPICGPEEIIGIQQLVRRIAVKPSLRRYVAEISAASREHPDVMVGISVRGSQRLMTAAQAMALFNKRDYIIPDDIQNVAPHCLAHRILLRPEAKLAGVDEKSVLKAVLRQIAVPAQ